MDCCSLFQSVFLSLSFPFSFFFEEQLFTAQRQKGHSDEYISESGCCNMSVSANHPHLSIRQVKVKFPWQRFKKVAPVFSDCNQQLQNRKIIRPTSNCCMQIQKVLVGWHAKKKSRKKKMAKITLRSKHPLLNDHLTQHRGYCTGMITLSSL